MRRRVWRPKGGIGGAIDLIAGLLFWIVLIFLLVDLVQIGRAWQVTQTAAYDAAQGVAAYGCWTPNVTDVVRSDLANITLAPGHTASASVTTAQGALITTRRMEVSAANDPAMTVTVDVPIEVGGWLHIPLMPVTMHGRTVVTSTAFQNEQLTQGGGAQCEAPQL
ncbi:MAG: hypothetical protein M0Z36_04250 [Thermaerobacter sp.]|nr:hypothetical protein [Thermaerobacter sp.]